MKTETSLNLSDFICEEGSEIMKRFTVIPMRFFGLRNLVFLSTAHPKKRMVTSSVVPMYRLYLTSSRSI